MIRVAGVVGAGALAMALVWTLGLRPLGDGELIDGQVVGAVTGCSSTPADWHGDDVDTILHFWPDGHPPIREICHHRPRSNEGVSLGNPRIIIVNLQDGRRVARRFSGVGCAVDQTGTPQACRQYDPRWRPTRAEASRGS